MIEEKNIRYGPRHRTLERPLSPILAREEPGDIRSFVMTGKSEHDDLCTAFSYEAAEVGACSDGLMRPKTFLSLILIGRPFVLLRIYAGRYEEANLLGTLGKLALAALNDR